MKEDLKLLRAMPWKHKYILILIGVISIVLCGYKSPTLIIGLKYSLFFTILLCASYFDLTCRIIPDWIHILLFLIGLININVAKSVVGLIISPLPLLIMALINSGSIGGGDIKLIGVSGFVLGYGRTTTAAMNGIVVVACFYSLYYLSYKKVKCKTFPFALFFQVGCMLVLFLGG